MRTIQKIRRTMIDDITGLTFDYEYENLFSQDYSWPSVRIICTSPMMLSEAQRAKFIVYSFWELQESQQ